ncbi:CUB and sushi domain-containing protein 3 [Menidia menidia]
MGAQKGLLAVWVTLVCVYFPVFGGRACVRFKHLENGQTFFRYGGLLVIFRCRPGYKLHGYQTNSCMSGRWSRDLPVCVGSGCSSPGPPIHGRSRMNEDGSWVAFSCNRGFHLHGPSMLFCKGHTWNSTKPQCEESDVMGSVSSMGVEKSKTGQIFQISSLLGGQKHSHFEFESKETIPKFESMTQRPSIMLSNEIIYTENIPPPSNISTTTGEKTISKEYYDFGINATSQPSLPFLSPSIGPACLDPPVPAHGTFSFHNLENPGPRQFRQYIKYACYPGYTLAHGDTHSYCQQGGTWTGITPVCLESTSCSVSNGGCSQLCSHSQIYDQSSNQTKSRTRCYCSPGFVLLDDGKTCRDVDECAVNGGLGPCMQQCLNSPGSYRCSCTSGHILAGDGHSCFAECPAGYQKPPAAPPNSPAALALKEQCVDINECLEEVCEFQCINLPGSHRCICPRGYTLLGDGRCKDINECHRKNGGCSHSCVNTRGGYKCACPASHRLSSYSWKKCLLRTTPNAAG